MRFALIATLTALATLTAVSIAAAADNKDTKAPSRETTNSIPADAPYGGLTPKEHAAIRYQPCRDALGWVNGRLRCDNRY
jgi:hypothetical protein